MRTTVDIDAILLERVRERSQESGLSFREELNRVIQRGLRPEPPGARQPYSLPVVKMGGVLPGIDLTKANALAAALEDEEIMRKHREGH